MAFATKSHKAKLTVGISLAWICCFILTSVLFVPRNVWASTPAVIDAGSVPVQGTASLDAQVIDLSVSGQASRSASDIDSTEKTQQVVVHLFSSKTCPHCREEKAFLQMLKKQLPDLRILDYEVSQPSNSKLVKKVAEKLGAKSGGVPFTVIGDQYIVGFSDPETTGWDILALVIDQTDNSTVDLVSETITEYNLVPVISEIAEENRVEGQNSAKTSSSTGSSHLTKLPIFGELNLSQMSLPIVTFVLAFLDGFNPCAMWTLIFLISLLLGMGDRKRMLLLGSTFIFISGFIYFLFLTAWLNLFLFVGYVTWIRVVIGITALAAAGYYLWDFYKNKDGACKVDVGGKKRQVFEKLREIAHRQSLLISMAGIAVLAVAVNAVELVCSAGLPAVFTQLLTINNLPTWQYYLYMIFYIVVFMLDDLVVFLIAMVTLKSIGVDTKYARYSHLIGGILMLLIGLAMLFKPELLTFAN